MKKSICTYKNAFSERPLRVNKGRRYRCCDTVVDNAAVFLIQYVSNEKRRRREKMPKKTKKKKIGEPKTQFTKSGNLLAIITCTHHAEGPPFTDRAAWGPLCIEAWGCRVSICLPLFYTRLWLCVLVAFNCSSRPHTPSTRERGQIIFGSWKNSTIVIFRAIYTGLWEEALTMSSARFFSQFNVYILRDLVDALFPLRRLNLAPFCRNWHVKVFGSAWKVKKMLLFRDKTEIIVQF